jgi:hypothetical protein
MTKRVLKRAAAALAAALCVGRDGGGAGNDGADCVGGGVFGEHSNAGF